MRWWIRPLVRVIVALVLPFLVPAILTGILWALPGNPADIICPPAMCPGTEELARRWDLHAGPTHYYVTWMKHAATLDLGRSWRVYQGTPVWDLMIEQGPSSLLLVALSTVPLLLGSVLAAIGVLPRRLDALWQGLGLAPSVILALVFAAFVTIQFGAMSTEGWPALLRIALGALVLGVADGALASAVTGTRAVLDEEVKQRYVGIAILRGEGVLSNTLPNVLPALIGQFRGRVLHILSGAVVVEVVLEISGIGAMLWTGTLQQDFGVVMASAWVFTVLSSLLLLLHATSEILIATHVRRAPAVPG